MLDNEFVRLSYSEGVKILEDVGSRFEFPVYWGADLAQSWSVNLVEEHFKRPVIPPTIPRR